MTCAARTAFCLLLTLFVLGTATVAAPTSHLANEMEGTDGEFGQTFTLKTGFDFTVSSAEYTVSRVSAGAVTIPKADEKLLIIHVKVRNGGTDEATFDPTAYAWTAVDTDGQEHAGGTDYGRLSSEKAVGAMKAGAAYDDVFTSITLPARLKVVKLILSNGRVNTSDKVLRYKLGAGKNIIAPLPDFVRDPLDPDGETALSTIPHAHASFYYPLGLFDAQLLNIRYSDGPVGVNQADEGKHFMVVTLAFRNQSPTATGISAGTFNAKVDDDADQDYPCDGAMPATVDEDVAPDQMVNPSETFKMRYYVQVPKTSVIRSFTISEGDSRSYVYTIAVSHHP
jgi:hypothetical protein